MFLLKPFQYDSDADYSFLKYCSRRLEHISQPAGTYVPGGWNLFPRRLEQYIDRYIIVKLFQPVNKTNRLIWNLRGIA